MEYIIEKINSEIELPFKLINFANDDCQFVFQFLNFDEGQTDFSILQGGVIGQFGVKYDSNGINCNFTCDVTIGNVYKFYQEFKKCYENISGMAVLEDYSCERTKLVIKFDDYGHCLMDGLFSNKNDFYNSAIIFKLNCDQSYFQKFLHNFEQFFSELERIQKNSEFLY